MKDLHLLIFGAILQVSHILRWNATLKFYLQDCYPSFWKHDTVFRRGYKLNHFYKFLYLCKKIGKNCFG